MNTNDDNHQNLFGEEFQYFLAGYTTAENRIETLRRQRGESAYWALNSLTRYLDQHFTRYLCASSAQNPIIPSVLREQGQTFAYALAMLDLFAGGKPVSFSALEKAVVVLQTLGAHRGDAAIERLVQGSEHQPEAIAALLQRFYQDEADMPLQLQKEYSQQYQ